jgi:hypothetical protein
VLDHDRVSRSHADIQYRQGKFILVDGSTNGTYLFLENGARYFVQREEFPLHDRGIICLGQAVVNNSPDLIRYECIQKIVSTQRHLASTSRPVTLPVPPSDSGSIAPCLPGEIRYNAQLAQREGRSLSQEPSALPPRPVCSNTEW